LGLSYFENEQWIQAEIEFARAIEM